MRPLFSYLPRGFGLPRACPAVPSARDSLCASGFIAAGPPGNSDKSPRAPSPSPRKKAYFRTLTSPDRKELPHGDGSLAPLISRRAARPAPLLPCIIELCIPPLAADYERRPTSLTPRRGFIEFARYIFYPLSFDLRNRIIYGRC